MMMLMMMISEGLRNGHDNDGGDNDDADDDF